MPATRAALARALVLQPELLPGLADGLGKQGELVGLGIRAGGRIAVLSPAAATGGRRGDRWARG